jgi:hypothetical protein
MGARTSTSFKRVRGDLDRDRSALEDDAVSSQVDTLPHGLSVVHFDEDQDDCVLEDETFPTDRETKRSRPAPDAPRLAELIEERISARTSGRIRNLHVTCQNGHVTIRGQCATFYTKQLAQHAAMGVIEDETVVNEISVGFCR